jgi:hypothetical protein
LISAASITEVPIATQAIGSSENPTRLLIEGSGERLRTIGELISLERCGRHLPTYQRQPVQQLGGEIRLRVFLGQLLRLLQLSAAFCQRSPLHNQQRSSPNCPAPNSPAKVPHTMVTIDRYGQIGATIVIEVSGLYIRDTPQMIQQDIGHEFLAAIFEPNDLPTLFRFVYY